MTLADPRPQLVPIGSEARLVGSRCEACGYAMVVSPPRCPVCGGGPMSGTEFGPGGTVFSATVLRIPVPGREPPYGLAYVDVDDGPRILAHVAGALDEPLEPGRRVHLVGTTDHGDPLVEVAR